MKGLGSGKSSWTAGTEGDSAMSSEPEEQVTQVTDASARAAAGAAAAREGAAANGTADDAGQVPRALAEAREKAAAGDVAGAIEAYRTYSRNASETAHARIELARLYESKNEWQLALEQY